MGKITMAMLLKKTKNFAFIGDALTITPDQLETAFNKASRYFTELCVLPLLTLSLKECIIALT